MHRIIFHFGNFTLYAYGFMQALAFVCAIIVLYFLSKREGLDKDRIYDMAIWIVIGGILGARIWFVIENFRFYKGEMLSILKIWEGGMVFYGGFIGGFITGIIYLVRNKMDINRVGDIAVPAFSLGIFFGRIGCFLNGCCYGRVSEHFGICFPKENLPPPFYDQMSQGLLPHDALCSLPVIPTQLIESFASLLIFAILLLFYFKRKFVGMVFYSFFIMYGIERFLLDYLRYYSKEAMIFKIFSLSQITSLFLIIAGVIMLIFSYRKSRVSALKLKP